MSTLWELTLGADKEPLDIQHECSALIQLPVFFECGKIIFIYHTIDFLS